MEIKRYVAELNKLLEDCDASDFGNNWASVVLASDHDRVVAELRDRMDQYMRALDVLFDDSEGDLDYIKWYITNKILTIEARNAIAALKESP